MPPAPAERSEPAGHSALAGPTEADTAASDHTARSESCERDELALRQLSLVTALVARGAPPAGVDPGRVRVQAAALVRKRSRSVAARAPALAAALGADFWPAFQDYDAARAGPPPAGSAADAPAFARFLTIAAGKSHTTPEVRRAARAILRPGWLRRRLASSAARTG